MMRISRIRRYPIKGLAGEDLNGVDPDRAVADVNIPRAMVKALGHALCGVYAEVVATGRVVLGDTFELA